MDDIIKMLIQGKKASITFVIVISLFLGYQYAEFRLRLSRIEERLTDLEKPKTKVAHVATSNNHNQPNRIGTP